MIAARGGDQSLKSCLYEGVVTHRRRTPFEHRFQYRLYQFFLDLDEIEELFSQGWVWSTSRFAPIQFRRCDHLGSNSQTLKDSVRELLNRELDREIDGPIRLLTQLRYYGFLMNPVSFYYCYEADGHSLAAVIAEVNNTPWGEQHCYVLPWPAGGDQSARFRVEKNFHVSPFMPMDMEYRWDIASPGDSLKLRIENHQADELKFDAVLNLSKRPLTNWSLCALLVRDPWISMKIFSGIYWQALKLWWKGAPYFPHPPGYGETTPVEPTVKSLNLNTDAHDAVRPADDNSLHATRSSQL